MHHLILVALLGHPSFQTRQAATLALQNDLTSFAAVQLATFNPDPEIATRASRIQCGWELSYIPMWLCRIFGESENLPYIDSIPEYVADKWTIIANARAAVSSEKERYGKWWKGEYGQDRAATAAFLWDRRNDAPEDLRKLFKTMQERSKYWDENNKTWPPETEP